MVLTAQKGDVILGDQVIATPRQEEASFNFGPASGRDAVVYTCERPGGDLSLSGAVVNTLIPTVKVVQEWMQFMTAKKIQHVFILLSETELEDYEEPGLIQAYNNTKTITVHHIPFASEDSYRNIMAELDTVYNQKEKAVVHCTHGMGRSGRVAAGWLVHKYGLDVEQATEEVLETARQHGVERMGNPRELTEWIETK